MGRGLFSGVIWGSVIAVMSLWLLSQLGGMVGLLSTPPQEVAVVAPEVAPVTSEVTEDATPSAPVAQGGPSTDPSRQNSVLETTTTDLAPQADRQPAHVPNAGNVGESPVEPVEGSAPLIETTGADATQVTPDIVAPTPPSLDSAPEPETTAPVASIPETDEVAPATPVVPESDVVIAQGIPTPEIAPTVGSEPVQPSAPATDKVPATSFSQPTVVEPPVIAALEPEPESESAPKPTQPKPDDDSTGGAPSGLIIDGLPSSGRSNQLPTIGGTDDTAEPETEELPVAPTDGPAIKQFAQEFENPDRRPLMAVLLLDSGNGADLVLSSEPLPFPVSYIVDASLPNARATMRAYRDAGHEVLALTPLPEGATPKDVEVAFQTYLTAVPEAVVVMDMPAAVFQSGRIVATQVAEALAASGHGMITYSRGLNSATQVAEREGVPVALVFREFDNDGQDSATIKKFLDQAAFRAGQQSGVIMVGHNRAETITALLEWSLGNRASTVALAPVSAALLAQ